MNTAILKSLLIMYENKRAKKMAEAEKRKEKLYAQNPRFSEIDNQLSTLSISASKNLISSSNFEYLDNLRKQIERLKKEKKELLLSVTNDENYLYQNMIVHYVMILDILPVTIIQKCAIV